VCFLSITKNILNKKNIEYRNIKDVSTYEQGKKTKIGKEI